MTAANVESAADPQQSAKAAGLRYITDEIPGIRRRLAGKHFEFIDPKGKPIEDEAEIARIRALAIPPAYTDVWISPIANGHLQATGRDARGRKQYRYHKRWREARDETKYERMLAFAKALPKIREQIDAHMQLPGLPREKVLATVVQLLETTLIRVGNEEYARDNKSYGLTTMKDQHVKISGSTLRFAFKGKSGVRHAIDLRDRRLARIVQACRDIPGQDLFQYIDDEDNYQSVDSQAVNDYIKEISGDDFSAKDFRTWVGTVACALSLAGMPAIENEGDAKRNVVEAVKEVALRLGNTPAVCRKCYVHPNIIDEYLESGPLKALAGAVAEDFKTPTTGLRPEEKAVVRFLEKRAKESDAQRTTKQLKRSLRKQQKQTA
ncbi:MAG: DNA topoisomerase IB [Candidatus Eremiobacteraeota bacterium]|nr:DNA topoisomerase IB [Candidatus Eremiobacteraeota bacterium]